MSVSIIVSGNLTGFSRFYANAEAKELYADAKFDLDYRNPLFFLEKGVKAYVISFSHQVIAVSLVSRILDSFNRSGILDMTVLLPRRMRIVSTVNSSAKDGLYQLLNELNDRFRQMCFDNGMLNQNASILMQDYYEGILSKYQLEPDDRQRMVNGQMQAESVMRKVGYVAAAESDMPAYLASLCRRSYEGYNDVILSPHAPQNIDEPAEEVPLYRVSVTNSNRMLGQWVKLTDQIPVIPPSLGQKDFDQHFSYQEILDGMAGDRILAILDGETIRLTYYFEEEQKTVSFVFLNEKGDRVDFEKIIPVSIEYGNGVNKELSSDTMIFRGKELYGKKTIKCGNPNYKIVSGCSNLDLESILDGNKVYVRLTSCCVFMHSFPIPYNVPKTFTFRNGVTGGTYIQNDVRNSIRIELPGKLTDWIYQIESDDYETLVGSCSEPKLDFKKKQVNHIAKTDDTTSKLVPAKKQEGGTVVQEDYDEEKKKARKKRKMMKLAMVSVCLLAIISGIVVGIVKPWEDSVDQVVDSSEELTPLEETKVTKKIYYQLFGADNDKEPLSTDLISQWIKNGILQVQCNFDGMNVRETVTGQYYYYKVTDDSLSEKSILMSVFIDSVSLIDTDPYPYQPYQIDRRFKNVKTPTDTIDLKLDVSQTDIELYREIFLLSKQKDVIEKMTFEKLKEKFEKQKKECKNTNFCNVIDRLLVSIEQIIRSKESEKLDVSILDKWDIDENLIKGLEKDNGYSSAQDKEIKGVISKNAEMIDENTTVMERVDALKEVIGNIRNGEQPSWNYLSKDQAIIVQAIFADDKVSDNIKRWKKHFDEVVGLKSFIKKIKDIDNGSYKTIISYIEKKNSELSKDVMLAIEKTDI